MIELRMPPFLPESIRNVAHNPRRLRTVLGAGLFAVALAGCFAPPRIALPRAVGTTLTDEGFVEIGRTVAFEIQPDESHEFSLWLDRDAWVQVVVEQHGIDVAVFALGPDDEVLAAVTSRERIYGPELLYFLSATRGLHRIAIQTQAATPRPGAYEMTIESIRAATPADEVRIASVREWQNIVDRLFPAAARGDWQRVGTLFGEWMRVTERFDPRDYRHRDVAVGAATLARLHWNRTRDRAIAEPFLRDAIALAERTHGEGAWINAPNLAALANFLMATGRAGDALPVIEDARRRIDAQTNVEPIDEIVVMQALGRYRLRAGPYEDAVAPLERAYDHLSNGRSPISPAALGDAAYDLGRAYLLNEVNPAEARDLLRTSLREDYLDPYPMFTRFDRASELARAMIELREYEEAARVLDETLVLDDGAPSRATVRRLVEQRGRIDVLRGRYPEAESSYRHALELASEAPPERSRILTILASLALDQGRYRDADALLRSAVEAGQESPTFRPVDIARLWAVLLEDAGYPNEADALRAWNTASGALPAPDPVDLPETVEVAGLSPERFLWRLGTPYGRDLGPLWQELGIEPWTSANDDCRYCSWRTIGIDPQDEDRGVIVILQSRNPDADRGASRLLLFQPAGTVVAGVREWEVADHLDVGPNMSGRVTADGTGSEFRLSIGGTGGQRAYRIDGGRFVEDE